jgi:hypothetical protein
MKFKSHYKAMNVVLESSKIDSKIKYILNEFLISHKIQHALI